MLRENVGSVPKTKRKLLAGVRRIAERQASEFDAIRSPPASVRVAFQRLIHGSCSISWMVEDRGRRVTAQSGGPQIPYRATCGVSPQKGCADIGSSRCLRNTKTTAGTRRRTAISDQ